MTTVRPYLARARLCFLVHTLYTPARHGHRLHITVRSHFVPRTCALPTNPMKLRRGGAQLSTNTVLITTPENLPGMASIPCRADGKLAHSEVSTVRKVVAFAVPLSALGGEPSRLGIMKGLSQQQPGLQRGVTAPLPAQISILQYKSLQRRYSRLHNRYDRW